ncbi:hypothetical protein VTK56DRAFT_910 [Thermocarpiscus australiensis]
MRTLTNHERLFVVRTVERFLSGTTGEDGRQNFPEPQDLGAPNSPAYGPTWDIFVWLWTQDEAERHRSADLIRSLGDALRDAGIEDEHIPTSRPQETFTATRRLRPAVQAGNETAGDETAVEDSSSQPSPAHQANSPDPVPSAAEPQDHGDQASTAQAAAINTDDDSESGEDERADSEPAPSALGGLDMEAELKQKDHRWAGLITDYDHYLQLSKAYMRLNDKEVPADASDSGSGSTGASGSGGAVGSADANPDQNATQNDEGSDKLPDTEPFPETTEKQLERVKELVEAIFDFSDVIRPTRVVAKRRKASGSADTEQNEGEGAPTVADSTHVRRVKGLSNLEVEMLAWDVLMALRNASNGILGIPRWAPPGEQAYENLAFGARFNLVRNALRTSKAVVNSLMATPFVNRLAAAPQKEYDMKRANKEVNEKKQQRLQLAQALIQNDKAQVQGDDEGAEDVRKKLAEARKERAENASKKGKRKADEAGADGGNQVDEAGQKGRAKRRKTVGAASASTTAAATSAATSAPTSPATTNGEALPAAADTLQAPAPASVPGSTAAVASPAQEGSPVPARASSVPANNAVSLLAAQAEEAGHPELGILAYATYGDPTTTDGYGAVPQAYSSATLQTAQDTYWDPNTGAGLHQGTANPMLPPGQDVHNHHGQAANYNATGYQVGVFPMEPGTHTATHGGPANYPFGDPQAAGFMPQGAQSAGNVPTTDADYALNTQNDFDDANDALFDEFFDMEEYTNDSGNANDTRTNGTAGAHGIDAGSFEEMMNQALPEP